MWQSRVTRRSHRVKQCNNSVYLNLHRSCYVMKRKFCANTEKIWTWVFSILIRGNVTSECGGLCMLLLHCCTCYYQRADMMLLDCVNVPWIHITQTSQECKTAHNINFFVFSYLCLVCLFSLSSFCPDLTLLWSNVWRISILTDSLVHYKRYLWFQGHKRINPTNWPILVPCYAWSSFGFM